MHSETGDVPEARTSRMSARDAMLRSAANDPPTCLPSVGGGQSPSFGATAKEKSKNKEFGASEGNERSRTVAQMPSLPWWCPPTHAPIASYSSGARKQSGPSVPKESIPLGVLTKEFL